MKEFNKRFKNSFTLNVTKHTLLMFFRFTCVMCGCFLCQHFKINISFKRGKIEISIFRLLCTREICPN